MKVFGVDFSGAVDGGKYIWVAEGRVEDGTLVVESCERASDHFGARIEPCLVRLVEGIAAQSDAAFGCDFPFSVPELLLNGGSWLDYVRGFGGAFATPDAFRAACRAASGGRETKRLTDIETKTPFCSYNLRIYRARRSTASATSWRPWCSAAAPVSRQCRSPCPAGPGCWRSAPPRCSNATASASPSRAARPP
jgi:hypothetical protein